MLGIFETSGIVVLLSIICIIISVFFIMSYMSLNVNDKDKGEVNAKYYLEVTGYTTVCFSFLILAASFAVFSGKKDLSPIIDVSYYLMIMLFISICVMSFLCAYYIFNGVNKEKNVKEYKTCFGIGISSGILILGTIIVYIIYCVDKNKKQ